MMHTTKLMLVATQSSRQRQAIPSARKSTPTTRRVWEKHAQPANLQCLALRFTRHAWRRGFSGVFPYLPLSRLKYKIQAIKSSQTSFD
jgi:hypothetical protein